MVATVLGHEGLAVRTRGDAVDVQRALATESGEEVGLDQRSVRGSDLVLSVGEVVRAKQMHAPESVDRDPVHGLARGRQRPLRNETAVRREDLHPAGITDVDMTARIHGDEARVLELPRAGAHRSPRTEVRWRRSGECREGDQRREKAHNCRGQSAHYR